MKLKPMTYAATLLAALSLTGLASAQDGKHQGPPEGHRPPPQPLLKALDTDDDHALSADEISNASTSLKTLDKDGDGKLSKEELKPKKPEGAPDAGGPPPSDSEGSSDKKPKHPPFPSPVLKVLDADADGEISADEIANASTALLTLDKDGDGALSQEELRPPHKGGNGGPPEGPPPAEGGESGGSSTTTETPATE